MKEKYKKYIDNAKEIAEKIGFEVFYLDFSMYIKGEEDIVTTALMLAVENNNKCILINKKVLDGVLDTDDINYLVLIGLAEYFLNLESFNNVDGKPNRKLNLGVGIINEILNDTDIYDEDLNNLILILEGCD